MTDERGRDQDVGAMRAGVVAAALRYRDAMRTFLERQAVAIAQGATLDELVRGNQAGFQEAAQAEEELFALLDKLETLETGSGIVLREQGQRL